MMELEPSDRARAHQALDRLLELVASHAPATGMMRLRLDRDGRLHLDPQELQAKLHSDLTGAKP